MRRRESYRHIDRPSGQGPTSHSQLHDLLHAACAPPDGDSQPAGLRLLVRPVLRLGEGRVQGLRLQKSILFLRWSPLQLYWLLSVPTTMRKIVELLLRKVQAKRSLTGLVLAATKGRPRTPLPSTWRWRSNTRTLTLWRLKWTICWGAVCLVVIWFFQRCSLVRSNASISLHHLQVFGAESGAVDEHEAWGMLWLDCFSTTHDKNCEKFILWLLGANVRVLPSNHPARADLYDTLGQVRRLNGDGKGCKEVRSDSHRSISDSM
jgi:hypothetical protein